MLVLMTVTGLSFNFYIFVITSERDSLKTFCFDKTSKANKRLKFPYFKMNVYQNVSKTQLEMSIY